MATSNKSKKILEKARKIAAKTKKKKVSKVDVKKKTTSYPEGQNAPQSKKYTQENDKALPAKATGWRWTKEGAKKLGKSVESKPTTSDIEKYRNETFKLKGKPNKSGPKGVGDGSHRYLYVERRADKADITRKNKLEDGGEMAKGGFIELELNKSIDSFDKHYDEVGFTKKELSEPYQKDGNWFVKTKNESIADQLFEDGFVKKYAKGGEVETALSKLKKFGAKVEQVGEKGKKKWYVYNDGQWGLAEDEEGFYASDDDLIEMAEEYASEYAKGGKIPSSEVADFKRYVKSFYGKDETWSEFFPPFGVTNEEVNHAVSQYIDYCKTKDEQWGGGDSFDREIVRDIMLYNRGTKKGLEYQRAIKEIFGKDKKEYGGILQPMTGGVNADPRFDIYNTTMFAKKGLALSRGEKSQLGKKYSLFKAVRGKGKEQEFTYLQMVSDDLKIPVDVLMKQYLQGTIDLDDKKIQKSYIGKFNNSKEAVEELLKRDLIDENEFRMALDFTNTGLDVRLATKMLEELSDSEILHIAEMDENYMDLERLIEEKETLEKKIDELESSVKKLEKKSNKLSEGELEYHDAYIQELNDKIDDLQLEINYIESDMEFSDLDDLMIEARDKAYENLVVRIEGDLDYEGAEFLMHEYGWSMDKILSTPGLSIDYDDVLDKSTMSAINFGEDKGKIYVFIDVDYARGGEIQKGDVYKAVGEKWGVFLRKPSKDIQKLLNVNGKTSKKELRLLLPTILKVSDSLYDYVKPDSISGDFGIDPFEYHLKLSNVLVDMGILKSQEEIDEENDDEYANGGKLKVVPIYLYEVTYSKHGKKGTFVSKVKAKSEEDAINKWINETSRNEGVYTIIDVVKSSRTRMEDGGEMAHGGATHEQGYDDREDESLAMRHGKIASKDFVGTHKRKEHSRRDDARFEERHKKAYGGTTDASIELLD